MATTNLVERVVALLHACSGCYDRSCRALGSAAWLWDRLHKRIPLPVLIPDVAEHGWAASGIRVVGGCCMCSLCHSMATLSVKRAAPLLLTRIPAITAVALLHAPKWLPRQQLQCPRRWYRPVAQASQTAPSFHFLSTTQSSICLIASRRRWGGGCCLRSLHHSMPTLSVKGAELPLVIYGAKRVAHIALLHHKGQRSRCSCGITCHVTATSLVAMSHRQHCFAHPNSPYPSSDKP